MKMTYKIVYNPELEDYTPAVAKDINFMCSDGRLHIRLRDYDHEEVIHGFINKLTYLVTYLFQRQIITDGLTNNIIEKFVKNDSDFIEVQEWLCNLFWEYGKNLKGLKISKNYRKIKKDVETPLGSFLPGTCPLECGLRYGNIRFFEDSLRMFPMEEFLLNDAVEIVISKETVKESYSKFTNKKKKVKKERLEYIPLF